MSPPRLPSNRRRAFTLIELLVVVMILGVLIAIALPTYLGSMATAKANACDHNARALASALQTYGVRNGAYPSAASGVSDPGIVTDMGGAIPNNPCSLSTGAAGYAYTYTASKSVSIAARNDAGCTAYTPKTFALSM